MSKDPTMPRPVPKEGPFAISTMGRREFDAFLYDLYGCGEAGVGNDATADADYEGDSISSVKVFNSPGGLIFAIHYGEFGEKVDVIVPATSLFEEAV